MGLGLDIFFKNFSKNIEKRHYVKSGGMTGKVNHKQNLKFEICSTWKKSRKFNLYFFLYFERKKNQKYLASNLEGRRQNFWHYPNNWEIFWTPCSRVDLSIDCKEPLSSPYGLALTRRIQLNTYVQLKIADRAKP